MVVKIWNSCKEAALSFNVNKPANITKCCRGESKSAYGYQWEYHEERLPDEIWIDHPIHPVKCSNLGRIQTKTGKISTGFQSTKIYRVFDMYLEGKRCYFSVHRLIAETFIPNPDNKPTVDHIDRDRTNNHITNLRWATMKEQMQNKTYLQNPS